MKKIDFRPQGVCARLIHITADDDNKVVDVVFEGGCDGNHKGLAALCKGRDAKELAAALKGITCGPRCTSCPDQLSKALESL